MTAMLSVSAAFVSCSDKEVFDQAAVEQAQVEKTEVQYKEAFVKHFGEVNPNQSWDFSQINYPQADQTAQTRAWIDDLFGTQLPAPTWSEPTLFESFLNALFYETHYQHAATDFEEVKQLVDNQPVVDWPYDYAQINLHPFYSHGSSVINYYFLGVQYNQKNGRLI